MTKRVMLVEDDVVIRDNYVDILTDEGFEVHAFGNRPDAMAHFAKVSPHLALLDIGLEEEREGGFRLCADLRYLSPKLPILFLTSHCEEFDRISALRLGADDYLTKDVSVAYLVVRIEALLRRSDTLANHCHSSEPKVQDLVRGNLKIDHNNLVVFWKDRPVDLTLTQFWIIDELAGHPRQVKSYSKLMHAANLVVEPNTINAHIKAIRDRFKTVDGNFNCIRTERGIGYRWVELRLN